MKKISLLILLLFIFSMNAQVKKTPVKKVVLTEEQKVKKAAQSYFEKIYVPSSFKDPYSYQLKKILVIGNSTEKVYNELLQDYSKQIEKIDTVWSFKKLGFAKEDLESIQRYYNKYVVKDKDNFEKYRDANSESSYKASLSSYEKSKKEYDRNLSSAESTHNYNVRELKKAIEEKSSIEELMKTLANVERQSILNYTVYIDAYGANSYGNKILGRYYFTVDKQGELIGSIRSFD